MTTKEFCKAHGACREGTKYALQFKTMRECYNALLNGKAGNDSAPWAIWVATRKGVFSKRDLRLLAVKCARRVQHLMKDQRSINALDVAERYANGEATVAELRAAYSDGATATEVAETAAYCATITDATEAASQSVSAATYAATAYACWDSACYYKERDEQLKILAELGNPFSEDED